jgi:hypothetical protein
MPIQAIRITMKGQQAIRHLTSDAPTSRRNPAVADPNADKLSLRKAMILVVSADGKWYTTRQLQRRLAETGEFDEWTEKVSLAVFQKRGLGDKLVNELINLSEQNYITIGRNLPRQCSICGETPEELIVVATMRNDTWDGSEAQLKSQTPPVCKECYDK